MKTFDNIWETIHNEMEWGKYPSEEVIRFVARNFYSKNRAETKLLDVGCGTGAITWYIAREGFQAFGFDGSATAVDKARKRMKAENVSAEIIVADACSTGYADEFFDGVIDSAMIYANTSEGIDAILKECYRILKKGGKMFSTGLFKVGMTGYGTGEKIEEHTYREMTEGGLEHRGTAHFFDREQILDYWTRAGFKDILVDSMDRTEYGGEITVEYFMVEATK